MSRRAKPSALRELIGGGGHRPLPKNEWKPPVGEPEMPRHLRPAARRAWKHWVATLLPAGILTIADGSALAMVCDAFADWEEAQKDILKNGLVSITPKLDNNNQPIMYAGKQVQVHKPNPAVAIKNKAMALMHTYLLEFGLTPASRPKIAGEETKPVNPLDDVLLWMPEASPEVN